MRFIIWLIPIIILSSCSANLGGTELKQKSVIVTESGVMKYYHYFQDTKGNKIKVETTKADFDKYSKTGQPTYKGMKWLYSTGGRDATTTIPVLNDNEYVHIMDESGNDKILIKEPSRALKEVNFDYLDEKL